ncbi:MAG: 3-oxoacyl-[acyl-carrier-protein] reductase [Candidatus Xenobia bacterium]
MEPMNKTALVTGATKGIGRAIAVELARHGCDVAVNGRDEKAAESVVEEILALGRKARLALGDVSQFEAAQGVVNAAVEALGRLDILVNNAGITRDGLLLRMKEADWDAVLDANLKSVFNCTRAASRVMLRQKSGRIVNVSSIVGLIGNPGQANYAASKAGIIGFTKAVAKELAGAGVTVNAVAPGFIKTDMTDKLAESAREALLKSIPMGAMGEPEDVARVVRFLASDDARYVTGQVLTVDGGLAM